MTALAGKVGARAAIATLVAVAATAAYLLAPSTGYTFAMGNGFDLEIDSTAAWNGVLQPKSTWKLKDLVAGQDRFFTIKDVKPGDTGEATISLHVNKDAWICLDFENLKEQENGRNEPEEGEDASGGATSGELADGTEFFAWFDDKSGGGAKPGDNIFQVGEKPIFGTTTGKQAATQVLNQKTYALADSKFGDYYPSGKTKYIGIFWCAGDLTVNLATAQLNCDGTALGNEAQTDSFTADIGFRAVPKKDEPKFTCKKSNTSCEWPGGPVNIVINNSGTVHSTTTSSSNTGGNTAGPGGTVHTGNAANSSSTTTIINAIRLLVGGLRGR